MALSDLSGVDARLSFGARRDRAEAFADCRARIRRRPFPLLRAGSRSCGKRLRPILQIVRSESTMFDRLREHVVTADKGAGV